MREVEAERVSGAGEKTRCGREVERGTKWEPRRRSPARPRPSARGRRVRAPPLQPVRPGPLPSRPAGQAAGPALRGRAGAGARGGAREGLPVGGDHVVPAHSFFFFFYPFSLSSLLFLSKQGKVFREAVASFRLALPSPTLVPAPVWARAAGRALEAPSAPGGGGRGDWALGGFPRRHMAAAAPRAPRGAAPSLSEVRRLRPAAPEPSSG